MDPAAREALNAVEQLHGMKWFWKRTLWEIQYQPLAWCLFMLIVFALLVIVAYAIVYLTSRRWTKEVRYSVGRFCRSPTRSAGV